ncbi:Translation initiation factor IF-2 [Planctomycetes bacterium Pla163]|uniref:Translation initiation factor IF-2 n=1 Tax=Rohdeia mirabilis TaxID=2528008 RepID=A0A518D155_9BACT|nr:Translation initiation factor IF-2 [Planctomycetes bacterium Pla163]
MSKKADFLERLLDTHQPRRPFPESEVAEFNPLEQGLLMVLLRHMTQSQAEASIKALQKAYEDWNELRVSQAQEIAQHFRTSTRKKGYDKLQSFREVALDLKEYIQEVYQQTHSIALDRLVADVNDAWKMLEKMPVTGIAGGAYLMWVANREVPVHANLVKLLDKLDLVTKPGTGRNAVAAVSALVPKGREREFTIVMYDVLEHWEDEENPSYVSNPILQETAFGKKAFVERETARAKADAARQKEEERIKKEEERERKRIEAEEKKRIAAEKAARKAEEAARKKAEQEAEKKRAIEAKKVAAEKERKEREAAKKKEAAAKEAAKKKAAAAAKVAAKKEAAKKAAAKKAAAKKASAKKSSTKKSSTKKPASAKAAAKRPTTKKSVAKKAPAKKAAAKKSTTKAGASKKGTTSKAAAKKSTTKKAVAKKSTTKKAAKKPAKRVARR